MRPIKLIIRFKRPTWHGAFLLWVTILLTTITALFAFRNPLLQFIVNRKIDSFLAAHPGVTAHVGDTRFEALSRIVLEDIHLQSQNHNLSLMLGRCSLQLTLQDLLMRRLQPRRLELNDLKIDIRQQQDRLEPSRKEQQFALPPDSDNGPYCGESTAALPKGLTPKGPKVQKSEAGFSEKAAAFTELLLSRIPGSLVIDRLSLSLPVDDMRQEWRVSRLEINDREFQAPIRCETGGNRFSWLLKGQLNRKSRRLSLLLTPAFPDTRIQLPSVDRYWNADISFSSASASLGHKGSGGSQSISGSVAFSDLSLSHPKIAAQPVEIPRAALDFNLHIRPGRIELAPPSRITLNRLSFHPTLRCQTAGHRTLRLRIDEKDLRVSDLFESLPPGLFSCLAGIEVGGRFDYHLDFAVDFSHPQEISLEAEIQSRGMEVKRFGTVDFRAVNEAFEHEVFEKDQWVRTIHVGPDNPDFRGLERISPYLRNAVLICEDGAFFRHRGFLVEPFKNAIRENLQQGRFVRGGSTISMQLVKNLFLVRQKTIARKLEEMLITWLIEENRLIGKDRMFEIYLNIIEWGPGVYGAAEAARFYFDKDPGELDLAESIFLASIVPRPRRFAVAFDREGKFKEWMIPFYEDVSRKMLQREMIGQADFDRLVPEIRLTGPARLLLRGRPAEEDSGVDGSPE